MNQQITKKTTSLTKFLYVTILGLSFSCMQPAEIPRIEKNEFIQKGEVISSEYERNLAELSIIFGEVLKDPEALEELFSFAAIESNSGSIKYNLKTLFESSEDPIFRKKSAIVDGFKKVKMHNARLSQVTVENDLVAFIQENNISVTAPYLAEDFNVNEISELTVSWWTEEFEQENFQRDENWTGKTKAIKLNLNTSLDKSIGELFEQESFLVDDEWAMENPTLVLGSFGDLSTSSVSSGIDDMNNFRVNGPPVALCNENGKSSQNLIVKMPAIRLEDNIAPWPKDNFLYMWVGTAGNITLGANNVPTITPSVNMPLADFPITRKEARIQRWKSTNTPFIISSWKPDADNMFLVWGYERNKEDIDYTGAVKATKDGISAELSVKIASREEIKLISALSFDKCYTIHNNVNGINQGYGFYGNTTLPRYPFGNVRAYFTLETL